MYGLLSAQRRHFHLTRQGCWTLLLACILIASAGCATNPQQHARALAKSADLQLEQISTELFQLTTYIRITDVTQPLNIYIEGDGYAWQNRYTPSRNPTPRRATGLTLAAVDPNANVVYIARPCQFTAMVKNPRCNQIYWTSKRFAPEVVNAINSAISEYALRFSAKQINLIGYSGGGAIAVLVAAQREDVVSVRTVAGNLDHDNVNRWHKVSLMPDSLNPINVTKRIAHIPQIHFSGANDKILPTAIAQSFARKTGVCAAVYVVDGLSHEGDWSLIWPHLLTHRLPCAQTPYITTAPNR